MENNTQNNFQNSNAAYLSSPFNFKNELKKFNWLYFIFGIVGFFIDTDTYFRYNCRNSYCIFYNISYYCPI